jgi:hypothetical protein
MKEKNLNNYFDILLFLNIIYKLKFQQKKISESNIKINTAFLF